MPDTPTAPTLTLVPARRGNLPNGCGPALGSTRRLQVLAAAGWPARVIARAARINPRTVAIIRAGQRRYVTPETAGGITDTYERLAGLDPAQALPRTDKAAMAITRTQEVAQRAGWTYTTHDWDGLNMDDPAADPTVYTRRPAGRTATAEDVLELIAHGGGTARIRAAWKNTPTAGRVAVVAALSDEDRPGGARKAITIAELVGTTARTVVRYRQRARELAAPVAVGMAS